jgi:hypothetical protein
MEVMFWLLDAYAPFILKCIFDIFWNVENFKRKIYMYIFKFYVRTKSFHEKSTCHLGCVKKAKFRAKNKVFLWDMFYLFYTNHEKMSVFHETVWMLIDCRDVNMNVFVRTFWQSEICFFWVGHTHPGAQFNFRPYIGIKIQDTG